MTYLPDGARSRVRPRGLTQKRSECPRQKLFTEITTIYVHNYAAVVIGSCVRCKVARTEHFFIFCFLPLFLKK